MAAALRPTQWWVLGAQPIAGRDGWYGALDVAIRTDDGELRVGGVRTADWFTHHHATSDPATSDPATDNPTSDNPTSDNSAVHGPASDNPASVAINNGRASSGLRANTSTDPSGRPRTSALASTGDVVGTDFDPAAVHHWDFSRLLWVGPSAAERLIWSNAEALTAASIATLLCSPGGAAFLAGPTGTGLPTAASLGLAIDTTHAGEPITVDW